MCRHIRGLWQNDFINISQTFKHHNPIILVYNNKKDGYRQRNVRQFLQPA